MHLCHPVTATPALQCYTHHCIVTYHDIPCRMLMMYTHTHMHTHTCTYTREKDAQKHTHTHHGSKRPRKKSTKLTSWFHWFRPQSRKNEISEISLGQKCVIQIEMSNSRIACTVNGERRSSWNESIVGDKMRLRFWNKHQKMHLVFMQLARYNWMYKFCLFVWVSKTHPITGLSGWWTPA